MMHAIVAGQAGGPEVLELAEAERPVPGPGQLLVKVAAVGVNFIDTYKRGGVYKVSYPFTPGSEASGTVEETGDGVTVFSPATGWPPLKAPTATPGYILVDEDKALPVPDGVDDFTAAALPLQGITAHYLINSSFRVEPGQTVLLHAGAGGVGLLLIQLLKAKGASVITTVSTDEKEQLAREAGADHVLRYDGFAAEVRELTTGPARTWCTTASGRTRSTVPRALRIRGTLVLFGAASGPVPPVDPQRLNAGGSLYLTRPTLAHFLRNPRNAAGAPTKYLPPWPMAASGSGSAPVIALAEAGRAHEDLEQRRTTGKVILFPNRADRAIHRQ